MSKKGSCELNENKLNMVSGGNGGNEGNIGDHGPFAEPPSARRKRIKLAPPNKSLTQEDIDLLNKATGNK